jgi:hypothetical protein
MSNINSPTDSRSATDSGGGQGDASTSSQQMGIAIRADRETQCDSESELHLDGEEVKLDTLYRDGIDIEEDYDTLAGTDGSAATIP